ncbi:MAG: DEAD/DEAH box helicase family protein, partial [Aeriscardovia sp.]|nr:DEAD/DEAH box helicase family protein [Aeriscardovia sp.]
MPAELRPYQEEARQAIETEWASGRKNTLLVLPTGTGKTVVFSKVTEDMVRNGDRVLIMAHRGELLDQAADKLEKITGLTSAIEKADETCIGKWNRVTVGSVQSLQRPQRLEKFPGDYFST